MSDLADAAATSDRLPPPSPLSMRMSDAQPLATFTVALVTVATVVSMCRLFPDWAYLRPAITTVLGVHLVAFALRFARAPGWLAVPLSLASVAMFMGLVYYRGTTSALLPTGDTIDVLRSDLRLVWQQFPRAVAPVPSAGSFAAATALLMALCAAIADLFAFRAFGRAEALAPTGVSFIFASALGTDRNQVAVAALWIGAALIALAALHQSHTRDDGAWMGSRRRTLRSAMPATLTCAMVAALGAGLLAPSLPGAGERALLDARNRGGVTNVLSPLVDIRSRLVNLGNQQMFTVSADRPAYWRAIGLTEFDGTTWTPPSQDLEPASGSLPRAAPATGPLLAQTIVIKALGGNLVPAAASPLEVGTPGIFWAAGTQTLVFPGDGLVPGDTISVLSMEIDPDPAALRRATASFPPDASTMLPPKGFPDEAARLAREVTAGAATPYDQALRLQDWFRTNFTYDLTVQSGHSDDAIANFLRIRRGYCEQFAGTFAAMARSIGLPARVAVGFTPGDLQSDGLYHVYGRYAHAWPEVWFDGIGWVMFEPTPGRGAPGAEDYTGVAAAQDTRVGGAGTSGAPAPVGAPFPTPADGRPTDGQAPGDQTTPTVAPATDSGGSFGIPRSTGANVTVAVVLALLVLLAGWMILMPIAVRRFSSRRPTTPRERVVATWRRTCGALRLAGAPALAGATPLEYADAAELATGIDHRLLSEVARVVTRAVYAPTEIDEATATRCEHLGGEIGELCRDRLPLTIRLRAHIDPRMAQLQAPV